MSKKTESSLSHPADQTKKEPTIGKSTLINFSGLLVPTIIALVTVPLYLHKIGEVRYGVLLLAFTFLGYFGAFDLGLGRAVAQRVARQDSVEERNHTFWTAFIISGAMGILGAVILYFLGQWLFADIFRIPANLRFEMTNALPWLSLIVPLTAIISVLAGALEGRQAFLALNLSQITGVIGLQMLPLSIALLGYKSMPDLLAAALIGRFIGVIVMMIVTIRKLPLKGCPHIHKKEIGPLIHFGSWMSLSGLAIPLLTIIDRFFIATLIGPAAVTAYTIPYNLTQKFTYLPYALSTTLFPVFSQNLDRNNSKLLNHGIKIIIAIQTPIIILGILLMQPFITYWIGPAISNEATPVAIILLVALWISGPAYIPHNMLPAIGKPDIIVKFYAIETLPFLILLYFFVKELGIIGAAISFFVRAFSDSVFCLLITKSLAPSFKYFLATSPTILISATISLSTNFGLLSSLTSILCIILSLYTSKKIIPYHFTTEIFKKIKPLRKPQGII